MTSRAPPAEPFARDLEIVCLESAILGSLVSSALGPPPQIPRGPASRAPHARVAATRLRTRSPQLEGRYRMFYT
ncbi:uncharacterized protein PITG_07642 [Phytophthora infestans T30-4]|uniref:Uncharacterized protein n=1 Tax=Phytophthora infestans (strain T30-4) TaxID=403677 RepID=D0N8S8_PHYIT|nr:uncharacterized protein PITG_07642 [Phytophthora infestans T30-4]EEY53963.1 hypothetical protein PITG_07642 [Phytophthora infestans T30-4]|eukprot:XP_002904594.1 hypothetical protein PITG_07642 [Phytophthora infestans T30-4]